MNKLKQKDQHQLWLTRISDLADSGLTQTGIGNSANVNFESYATISILNVFNTSTSQTKTIETFVFSDSSVNIKRLWVK